MIICPSRNKPRRANKRTMHRFAAGIVVGLLWTIAWHVPASANHYFFPQVKAQIERQVEVDMARQGFSCQGELICGVQLIPNFYKQRRHQPVWFDRDGLRPAAYRLIEILEQIREDGLEPTDYHLPAIQRVLGALNMAQFPPDESLAPIWAELDLILTDALLLVGAHLTGGRINPETLHADWIIPEITMDMQTVLDNALMDDRLAETIEGLRPAHPEYTGLKQALGRLRRIQDQGGWPRIADGKTLRPHETDARIPVLRQRMRVDGQLPGDAAPDDLEFYDDGLVAAVQEFQRRHGLKPDGIIGPNTRDALNISAAQRIRQIELNLERWRWLPRDLGERYIAVNTAAYSLSVVENHRQVLGMRVVVGKPARMTPVFSAQMSYMVLNPFWNVPYKLATEDILPKLVDGAEYLIKQSIKVFSSWDDNADEVDPNSVQWRNYHKASFPFRLRQEPGKKNALGQVKFMFPNKFAVYLHDTPQKSLFQRFQRDFSSGCIRVENARELASYLLSRDSDWNAGRLDSSLSSGQRQVVRIGHPIPVHLLYMTAWVDDDGAVQFRKDIYGRDRELDRALRFRAPVSPGQQMVPTESLKVY